MRGGYVGRILRVDLTRGELQDDRIDEWVLENFIGGRGVGIWLLYHESDPGSDPYAEENPLIFMTGPYTGTGVFSAFYNVTTRSPLTKLAASGHSGGTWGPWLKRAGYDGIVFTGQSPVPVYLLVEKGKARLLDAAWILGKGVRQTQFMIQERHGKVAVATIGPAGENRVRFASIMNDIHRAVGRGGVGAVMGSKNLKEMAVGGRQHLPYHDREGFAVLSRAGGQRAVKNAPQFAKYGTSVVLALMNEKGALPTRNFQAGFFEGANRINAEAMKTNYFVRDEGCFNCPLKCANIHAVPSGPFAVTETEGPEYETLMAFGPNCGNDDLASIIKSNDLCNDLGMDTISAGNTIAFLLDAYEQGLVDKTWTGGMDLGWGKSQSIVSLLEMMALRQGIGDLLAEGSVRAAESFGKGIERLCIHAKGQEFPGYEVRRAHGTGLSFATSSRGADHLRGCLYVEEIFQGKLPAYGFDKSKVEILVEKENLLAVVDSLVMCKFGQRNGEFTPEILTEILGRLTGMDMTTQDLLRTGERIYAAERMYNLRAGLVSDVLPERLFHEDLKDSIEGGRRISKKDFEQALQDYYVQRGWDIGGQPTNERLLELGLGDQMAESGGHFGE